MGSDGFIFKTLVFLVSISLVHCLEIPLSEGWSLRNANRSIEIINERLPSGVFSALENAEIVDSIFESYNDVNLRWIGKDVWTYSIKFDVSEKVFNHTNVLLVFHGLDTIATITLNNHELTSKPNNMFVRYRYDVKNSLITTGNNLEIEFKSPITEAKELAAKHPFTPPECPPTPYNGECHMNFLRKMQASFGWDWGLAAPSVGIWKPINLEVYDTAIIRDVTYDLSQSDDDWDINVSVYLESGIDSGYSRSFEGYLTLNFVDFDEIPPIVKHLIFSNYDSDVYIEKLTIKIPKNKIRLWWPNGYGEQVLYQLNVTWAGENRNIKTNEVGNIAPEFLNSNKLIKIGFRTIELSEDSILYGNAFYFKINGVPMFMKGTNWIPTDILPERLLNKPKLDYLMAAVKDANMNSIRVWGGGVYESDYFYDLADEYGILIWQDMMFACAMYPVYEDFLASVETEIAQNIRRIQRHPSILVWAGNNENEAALVQNWYGTKKNNTRFYNEYVELYKNTVKKAVRENDKWHTWLYSSPSNGNKLSTIINEHPGDSHYGDVHYYNYYSDAWNSNIFPKARFVSEYGFQSIPSIHSIKETLHTNDSIDKVIDHRQHFPLKNLPITTLIQRNLPMPTGSGEKYWKTYVYFSQLSQAMATKIETETYRIGRYHDWHTMGALYWQLNDVWVAPSWSSIEYNGNFKILHYWIKNVFAPVHVIANIDLTNKLNVYVVRDSLGESIALRLHMKIFNWSNLQSVYQTHWNISMPANSVDLIHQKNVADYMNNTISMKNSFFYFELEDVDDNQIVSTNFVLLDKLKDSRDIVNPNLQHEVINSECENNIQSVKIQTRITAPAIFVYIQIKNPLIEHYKLSKNGFIQLMTIDHIQLSFYNRNCAMAISNDDIEISTVNDFMIV